MNKAKRQKYLVHAEQKDDGSSILYRVHHTAPKLFVAGVPVDEIEMLDEDREDMVETENGHNSSTSVFVEGKEYAERPDHASPSTQSHSSNSQQFGYWPDADVKRLIKIYIKHVKEQPYSNGKASSETWRHIINEFDKGEVYTPNQIRGKLSRMKIFAKRLIENNEKVTMNKWPFFNEIKELLDMDEDILYKQPSCPFTTEDVKLMLSLYLQHIPDMVCKEGTLNKQNVWKNIAKAMGKPPVRVMIKFQSLKAKWRRWVRDGKDQLDPMVNILQELDDIMACKDDFAAEVARSRDIAGETSVKKSKCKWTGEGTSVLLELYHKRLLRIPTGNPDFISRKSVRQKVAENMDLPPEVVETKLNNLKVYYDKIKNEQKQSGWLYQDKMSEINKWEKILWGDDVEGNSSFENGEAVSDVKEEENDSGNFREPSWFRQYQVEVEERHRDRINVLNRLYNVMEKLKGVHAVDSSSLNGNFGNFDGSSE